MNLSIFFLLFLSATIKGSVTEDVTVDNMTGDNQSIENYSQEQSLNQPYDINVDDHSFIYDITQEKQNFDNIIPEQLNTQTVHKIPENILEKNNKIETLVNFNIEGKSLYDVIIALSELKKINILVPSFLEADKIIVNFSIGKNIPIEEVEDYLLYFINMAGFVLTLQDNVFIITKKTDDHLRRYNLPLYVNPKPNELPNNSSYIRVIYFLKYTKIPMPNGQGSEAIKQILFNSLPDKTNGIWVDPKTNSIMISGPSNTIANALILIDAIDNNSDPESVVSLYLKHTNASYVIKLIEDLLPSQKDSTQSNSGVYTGGFYFSTPIRTVLDQKENGIIFIGKEEGIHKVIQFITNYIDLPEPEGNLTVHVYSLKYLEAKKIAPILQDFVNGASTNSGEQSIKEKGSSSLHRKFDNVRIIPEEIVPIKRIASGNQQVSTKLNVGGNRLIIAASEEDYNEIEKIIESLDQFQPTIILEMIILDFEENIFRNYGSNTRLPRYFNLPMGAQIQSLMMDNSMLIMQNPGIASATISNTDIIPATTIGANLLGEYSPSGDSAGQMTSLANNVPRNGLIISLGESAPYASIWSVLQLQEDIARRSLVEHPTIVAQNNIPVKIQNIVVKRGAGELSPNNTQYGGATVVNINSYNASLAIELVPHLSFGSCLGDSHLKVNLEINIAMEDFKTDNPADFTKLNRGIKTTANINSGDILVIGGLHKESETKTISKVPFLGDIPLIGGLFRQTITEKVDSNLVFCIRPIVVENEEQLQAYTEAQTNNYKSELSQNCFTNCSTGQSIPLAQKID